MGDNLKAASQFVFESKQALDQLVTASDLDRHATIDQLAEMQRGAKVMNARSIYRAAQTAVDMLHKDKPSDVVQLELVTVRGLVEQYESGLDEVLRELGQAPVQEQPVQDINASETGAQLAMAEAQETPVNDMIADLNMQLTQAMPSTPTVKAAEAAHETASENNIIHSVAMVHKLAHLQAPLQEARSTLEPLIQFAPEGDQESLQRLTALYGQENLGETPGETEASQSTTVEFESLMPELTNQVLTMARHTGKTVSISYAANGIRLGAKMAEKLRPALLDMCGLLVNRSLETADVRRKRGESGAGHITIMASLSSGKIDIEIECTGRDLPLSECKTPQCQALLEVGGQMKAERKDDRFQLTLNGLPTYSHHVSVDNAAPIIMGQAS